MEQELLPFPEHLCSPPDFSEVRVTRALVFCVVFCRSLFVLFLLAIVLFVFRFTDSDYPLVSSDSSIGIAVNYKKEFSERQQVHLRLVVFILSYMRGFRLSYFSAQLITLNVYNTYVSEANPCLDK